MTLLRKLKDSKFSGLQCIMIIAFMVNIGLQGRTAVLYEYR